MCSLRSELRKVLGTSAAMDGRCRAHRDVLVAIPKYPALTPIHLNANPYILYT